MTVPYSELPGFPASGVTGHAGMAVAGRFGGQPVLMLAGRAHYYEHGDAAAMRPVIETLARAGIDELVLTNAAGSLDAGMPPGSVMLITDHINFSGTNPLFGEPSDRRFVGLTEAYDPALRGRDRGSRRCQRHRAPQGGLHVVLRAVLRDAGGDQHGAPAWRPGGRNVDRAGGDPRPLLRPQGGRLLGHHQSRRRDDGCRAVASGDQGHGASRRRSPGRDPSRRCLPPAPSHAAAGDHPHQTRRPGAVGRGHCRLHRWADLGRRGGGAGRSFCHGRVLQRDEPSRGRRADARHARFRPRSGLVRPARARHRQAFHRRRRRQRLADAGADRRRLRRLCADDLRSRPRPHGRHARQDGRDPRLSQPARRGAV